VSVNQALAVITFICGATLAGLAAIHFVWLNPAVIGPFALRLWFGLPSLNPPGAGSDPVDRHALGPETA
jgi:hypothetical protein